MTSSHTLSHAPNYLAQGVILLLLTLLSLPAWAEFELNIHSNSTALSPQQKFSINIIAEGTRIPNGDPPTQELLKGLEVLGRSSGTNVRISGGQRRTRKTWTYSVRAPTSGAWKFGPLQWAGKTSNTLQLQVGKPTANAATPGQTPQTQAAGAAQSASPVQKLPDEVILEADLDKTQVAVRQQLIYTARILYRVNIANGKISVPNFPDDVITYPLGNNSWKKIISGQQYTVQEWRHALFPQKSGALRIPPFGLDGHLRRNQRYRRINPKSKAFKVEVLPSPANFKKDEWVVARKLTLQEKWSVPIDQSLPIGQPINREITINVRGMPAEQLPALKYGDPPGMKLYPEQPHIKTETPYSGVRGVRIERMVMIPTQAGEVILPPIELRWWDSENGGIQKARLPERKLRIVANGAAAIQNDVQLAEDDDTLSAVTGAGLSGTGTPPQTAQQLSWFWWFLTLLAGAGWPLLAWRWWHERRLYTQRMRTSLESNQMAQRKQRQLLDRATNSARRGDASESSKALLQWAKNHWPENPPSTLAEIAIRTGSDTLSNAIRQLNAIRYQQERKDWDGTLMAEAIQGLVRHILKSPKPKGELPALYP
jgi:hypothetical protein